MRNRLVLVMLVLMSAFVISCQEEGESAYVSDQALAKTSELTNKLHRVALALAVDDNVLDGATCFAVKLPVQITVNGQPMLVDSPADYQQVAQMLAGTENDPDSVVFDFPIAITYENGNEVVVPDSDTFETLRQQCPADPLLTPIRCIGLVFPFTVSLYDPVSQTPQIVSISDGFSLVAFFENLRTSEFFQINYPMGVTREGVSQQVSNNAALQAFIDTFGNNCSSCGNPGILVDNDLILYVPFANQTVDLTGISNLVVNGTSVAFVSDRNGNPNAAFSFTSPGIGNNIEISGAAENDLLQSGGFTISMWFNRQNPQIFDFEKLFSNDGLEMSLGNPFNQEIRSPFAVANGMNAPLYDSAWIDGGLLGEINQWHHLVVTYDGTLLRLYRDGIMRGTSVGANFTGMVLRGGTLGGNFKGYIDDVRMYKRVLQQHEISVLFGLEGDTNTCMD